MQGSSVFKSVLPYFLQHTYRILYLLYEQLRLVVQLPIREEPFLVQGLALKKGAILFIKFPLK